MKNSSKDVCGMHVIVKGNVQGVGFRAMTRYFAEGLDVSGSVSNLPDGSVEIYAYGDKPSLEELMRKLRREAFSEHISEEIMEYIPAQASCEDFRILH